MIGYSNYEDESTYYNGAYSDNYNTDPETLILGANVATIDDESVSKKTVYSSEKVVSLINEGGFKPLVVDELPEVGESNVIYFVPAQDERGQDDYYDEYIWVDGKWEKIGSTRLDLSDYYTKEETDELLSEKQDTINDLSDIRRGAELGATALQSFTETDPTVPSWAKEQTKPTYIVEEISGLTDKLAGKSNTGHTHEQYSLTSHTHTAEEVGALPDSTVIPTSTSQLINDSKFITGFTETDPTVHEWAKAENKPTYEVSEISGLTDTLLNYYTTGETYTQTEVNNLIAAIDQFHYEIYADLSGVTVPKGNVLYLIGPFGTGSDQYEEYVYANSIFTKIGDTTIDLSDYATTSALTTGLAGKSDIGHTHEQYSLTSHTHTAAEVGALPDDTVIPSKTSDLANDSGFITGFTETDPTVHEWAKAENKPTYEVSEISGLTDALSEKQDTLTAGNGIVLSGSAIELGTSTNQPFYINYTGSNNLTAFKVGNSLEIKSTSGIVNLSASSVNITCGYTNIATSTGAVVIGNSSGTVTLYGSVYLGSQELKPGGADLQPSGTLTLGGSQTTTVNVGTINGSNSVSLGGSLGGTTTIYGGTINIATSTGDVTVGHGSGSITFNGSWINLQGVTATSTGTSGEILLVEGSSIRKITLSDLKEALNALS